MLIIEFGSRAQPNRLSSVWFSSIYSIEFDRFRNQTDTKFGVRFGLITGLNALISRHSIDYAGRDIRHSKIPENEFIGTLAENRHLYFVRHFEQQLSQPVCGLIIK